MHVLVKSKVLKKLGFHIENLHHAKSNCFENCKFAQCHMCERFVSLQTC